MYRMKTGLRISKLVGQQPLNTSIVVHPNTCSGPVPLQLSPLWRESPQRVGDNVRIYFPSGKLVTALYPKFDSVNMSRCPVALQETGLSNTLKFAFLPLLAGSEYPHGHAVSVSHSTPT